jgi:hypothetical protein
VALCDDGLAGILRAMMAGSARPMHDFWVVIKMARIYALYKQCLMQTSF